MMNRWKGSLLSAMILILAVNASFADDQLIDVVYLKDGAVLEGLIVDQAAGVSVKLATADRIVYTLSEQEIDRVVKKKSREPIPFSYGDVVLLKEGVMFRGTIVEQRPGVNIVLQTENDLQLSFPTGDIWKILKEKRIAGKVVEEDEKRSRNERERLKISLQIELVRDEIRKQEEQQRSSGEQAGTELEGEIDRLKEQMEDLEEAEEQIEVESVTDRRIEEREGLEELEAEIEELLEELTEMLEQCGQGTEGEQSASAWPNGNPPEQLSALDCDSFRIPERKPFRLVVLAGIADEVSAELYGDSSDDSIQLIADGGSDEQLSEQLNDSVAEIVDRTIYKIPTQEQIDTLSALQASYASLVDVLGSREWKRLFKGSYVRGLAEPLPVEDRVFLYETNRQKGAVLGALLNIIPVVYLGSWVQGDIWGALIGIAQTSMCVSAAAGLIMQDAVNQGYTDPFATGYLFGDTGLLFWAGTGLIAASYAFGFIEPFWYVKRINTRLKDRLLLDEETIRKVKREERRAALNPPALKLVPGRDEDLAVQLDLVSLSY